VVLTLNERTRFWSAWGRFLHFNFSGIDTNLSTLSQPEQIDVLVLFAQHVHSAGVSPGKQEVRAQTVQVSLRAVAAKFKMDGQSKPVDTTQGKYHQKISQLTEGYKLAVPLTVPTYMYNYGKTGNAKHKAIRALALIAFYYLLWVGGYTREGIKCTRT
jgi:hypothetical protein